MEAREARRVQVDLHAATMCIDRPIAISVGQLELRKQQTMDVMIKLHELRLLCLLQKRITKPHLHRWAFASE